MDWKIFTATFGTIFLAELGDKTQLANLSLTAKSRSPLTIAIASILAFSIVTIVTITFGALLTKYVRQEYIRFASGILFILIGVLMVLNKI